MRDKNQGFDWSINFHKLQVFGRGQDGIYQASNDRIEIVKIEMKHYYQQCLEYSIARNKNDIISNRNVSTTENFLIENLIEKMKPVVVGDKRG